MEPVFEASESATQLILYQGAAHSLKGHPNTLPASSFAKAELLYQGLESQQTD